MGDSGLDEETKKRNNNDQLQGPMISYYDVPSGNLTSLLEMAIEIVDLPIKNGDFP